MDAATRATSDHPRHVSLALSAALVVLGCKGGDDRGAVAEAAIATPPPTAADELPPATPRPPRTLPPPSHPVAELEPLLDLVPAKFDRFAVVRDPQTLLDGFERVTEGQDQAWAAFTTQAFSFGRVPALPDVAAIRRDLERAGVRLQGGMAFVEIAGRPLVVVAAEDAAKVRKQALAIVGPARARGLHCAAVEGLAGHVACSDDAATLDSYRPARKSKALRAELERTLTVGSIAAANVLASPGNGLGAAITTTPGVLQLDVVLGTIAEGDPFGRPGRSTGLGSVQAGQSFAWMRADAPKIAADLRGRLPHAEELASVAAGLTGEVVVHSPGSEAGLAILLGVRDPAIRPTAVSAFTAAMRDASEPFGDVEPEEINGVETVRVAFREDPLFAAALDSLGLVHEARGLVTDRWAVGLFGVGASIVPDFRNRKAQPPSSELLDALPPDLGDALHGGTASSAFHLELDGLHAPDLRGFLVESLAGPKSPWFPDADRLSAGLALLSSISSLSLWTTHHDDTALLHVAVRSFGDDHTVEGRAAQAARVAVETGKRSAAEAYGELVNQHRSSPRLLSFIARAGDNGRDGMNAMAALVMLCGSLLRAIERREGDLGLDPPGLRWFVPDR